MILKKDLVGSGENFNQFVCRGNTYIPNIINVDEYEVYKIIFPFIIIYLENISIVPGDIRILPSCT